MPVTLTPEHLEYMNLGTRYWAATRDELRKDQRDAIGPYLQNIEDWIRRGMGVYLYGESSKGKSYIAAVLCKVVWANYRVTSYCVTVSELKSAWMSNEPTPAHPGSKETMGQRIESARFVVVDDIGKEYRTPTGFVETQLNSLLRKRSREKKTTVFTSNIHVEDIVKVYGDSMSELIQECMIPVSLGGVVSLRELIAKKAMEHFK